MIFYSTCIAGCLNQLTPCLCVSVAEINKMRNEIEKLTNERDRLVQVLRSEGLYVYME